MFCFDKIEKLRKNSKNFVLSTEACKLISGAKSTGYAHALSYVMGSLRQ